MPNSQSMRASEDSKASLKETQLDSNQLDLPDLEKITKQFALQKIGKELVSFRYLDPLTNRMVPSSEILRNVDEETFQQVADFRKIQAWSENFEPQTYLRVLHQQTSLVEFDELLQQLKRDLKSKQMNKHLKQRLIQNNVLAFYQAHRLFNFIRRRL
mmetsp:Transcript_4793/g.8219  ORF Transcript_4793/g.8219 Transcript_4793/m.8219 type:complete len:157 (+) Transcript_4793:314-784(+)